MEAAAVEAVAAGKAAAREAVGQCWLLRETSEKRNGR